MKLCLILGVILACAASANAAQGNAPRQQGDADVKPVASRPPPSQQAQQSAPGRHLSDQERAELRRQLQQFNQQYISRRQ